MTVWKNIVFRVSGVAVDRSVSIIINILIARSTTNDEFGTILLIYSFADIAISIFDFGITSSAAIEFTKKLNTSQVLFLRLFLYKLLVIPVVFLLVYAGVTTISTKNVIAYVLLIVLIEGITDALQVVYCLYYAMSDFSKLLYANLVSRSVQFVFVLYGVINDFSAFMLLGTHIIHLFLQFMMLSGVAGKWYRQKTHDSAEPGLIQYFKMYTAMGWNKLLIVFSGRVDQIQLAAFLSTVSLSIYGVSQTFNRNMNIIGNSIGTVYLPEMSHYLSDKPELKRILKNGIVATFTAGFFVGLTIVAVSDFLINQLWGVRYDQSVQYTYLLALALPFEFANALIGNAFNLVDESKLNLIIKAVYFSAAFILNLFLIPLFGIFGLIGVYLFLTIAQTVAGLILVRKRL